MTFGFDGIFVDLIAKTDAIAECLVARGLMTREQFEQARLRFIHEIEQEHARIDGVAFGTRPDSEIDGDEGESDGDEGEEWTQPDEAAAIPDVPALHRHLMNLARPDFAESPAWVSLAEHFESDMVFVDPAKPTAVQFKDSSDKVCRLQESGTATEHVWLGMYEWDRRMHLSRKNVRDLLPFLIEFVLTGKLPRGGE